MSNGRAGVGGGADAGGTRAPPTAARLSSLSTSTLSQILELTRANQLNLPSSTSLTSNITRNLDHLRTGIITLENGRLESEETLRGLKGQYERLVGLVQGLGVKVEGVGFGLEKQQQQEQQQQKRRKSATGKLVDTGDNDSEDDEDRDDGFRGGDDDDEDSVGITLQPLSDKPKTPHIAITFPPEDTERDLEQMEEDEETMRRANAEVLQMQHQMMEDQDQTLNALSSAIARQNQLSLHISSELELQEELLDSTDSAMDRTTAGLRRASGRLGHFSKKAKDTGSTGLIVLLVIILVILIVVFKV